ncbi:hypothetical protein ABIE06_003921, partial [Pantoea dispersa]|uniref:hypothetical protein n=1 Tax=Pantoea dispersa TaxID=59814 RepID=UPI003D1EA0B9
FLFAGFFFFNFIFVLVFARLIFGGFLTKKTPAPKPPPATMWSLAFIATETSDETDWQLYQPVCAQNLSDPAGKGPGV